MKEFKNKRERLLEAAKEIFAEKGLEKSTVSEIVAKAGVAQGTFYLYFRSKNALISAIADDLLQKILHEMKKETAGCTDFWEVLKKIIDVTFRVTRMYKDVLALCYSGLAIEDSLLEWERIYNPYYAWLAEFIQAGIRNGVLRPHLDPNRTAKMVIGLIESAAEQTYLFDRHDSLPPEHQQDLFEFVYYALKRV